MASIPTEHQFKGKWRWPEDVESMVEDFTTGYTLNICCGLSPLGDVRVDASKDPAGLVDGDDPTSGEDLNNSLASDEFAEQPTMVADMKNLPFADESFEYVIFDPPWKMAYLDRYKPFYEAVRVCELGGHIIVNAKWPCESEYTNIVNPFDTDGDDEVMIVRADNPWRDTSLVTVHEKVQDQADLDNWIDGATDAAPTRPRPNTWEACYTCRTEYPRDELPLESPHTFEEGRFCSAECLHQFEDELGFKLTPVEPDEYDTSHLSVHTLIHWKQEGFING